MFKNKLYTKISIVAIAFATLLSVKVFVMPKVSKPTVTGVQSTLTQYDIDAKFDDGSKTFTATEKVNFTNTYGKSLNSLVFHLYADSYGSAKTMPNSGPKKEKLEKHEIGDINITKVTINGRKMEFTQDNEILKIKPRADIKPNESINIKIKFTLKLPMSQNRLGYYNNVYSVTNWYPIISIYDTKTDKWDENQFNPTGESNYSDIANYDVSINVSDKMLLAATGTTKSSKKAKKATKTYNVTAEKVRDFVFIMSPNFKVITKKCDDITVNSFYLDDGTKETTKRADELLDLSIDSLKFFGDKFGKYPYKEFDTVETYVEGFAMEYPQLIQMGKYSANYTPEFTFTEESIVHEIGHQWWYVTVGSNEFKDPFLDESLTAFSTAYYFEKKHGKYSSPGVVVNLRSRMDIFNTCSTPIYVPVDKIKNGEWSKLVYGMGALVFEDLRQKVGEEKFLKIIQTYYKKNTLKNATLDGLLSVIEEVGGKDAKDQVLSNITSKDFNPKHLALTKVELDEMKKENFGKTEWLRTNVKNTLMNLKKEKENKNSIASFFINAADNYYVYLVKPSNCKMSEDNKRTFNNVVYWLRTSLQDGFGLNVIVKDDKDLTEQELKENSLVFVGDTTQNTALKSVIDKFPIDFSKEEIKFNGVTIKNEGVSGMLAVDTAKNKNKNVLIFLGLDKVEKFNFLNGYDFYSKQFVLNSGNESFNGDYDTK